MVVLVQSMVQCANLCMEALRVAPHNKLSKRALYDCLKDNLNGEKNCMMPDFFFMNVLRSLDKHINRDERVEKTLIPSKGKRQVVFRLVRETATTTPASGSFPPPPAVADKAWTRRLPDEAGRQRGASGSAASASGASEADRRQQVQEHHLGTTPTGAQVLLVCPAPCILRLFAIQVLHCF